MKRSKVSGKQIIQYILLYIFLQMHGGTLWMHVLGNVNNKPLYILILIGIVIFCRKIYLDKKILLYLFAVFVGYIISALVNDGGLFGGDAYTYALSMIVGIVLAYVTVYVDVNMFSARLIKIVTMFASISVILYFVQIVFGPAVFSETLFPFCGARDTYGYIFYSICKSDYHRNYGIFYEPGVYQVLLCGALYFLTFHSNEVMLSKKKKRVFLFINLIAIFTSGSTSGYIATLIILGFQIFSKSKSVKKNAISVITLVGLFLMFDFIINANESIINTYVLSKFTDMKFTSITNRNYNVMSSGGARLFIIEMGLLALTSNPLWGAGNSEFNNLLVGSFWQNYGTGNALFIQLGKRGIIPVAIALVPLFIASYKSSKSKTEFIAFVLLYFNTVLAQSQLIYPMFAVFIFTVFIKSHLLCKNNGLIQKRLGLALEKNGNQ